MATSFFFLVLPGFFHSTVALLPRFVCCVYQLPLRSTFETTYLIVSSTCMWLYMISAGCWLRNWDAGVVFSVAASAILVWPFAGALGIPFCLHMVLVRRELIRFIKLAIAAAATFVPLTVLVDSWMYGKPVFPAMNIVVYNVLSSNTRF